MAEKLLSPKLDIVFKSLLTQSKELTKSFLRAVTGLPNDEFRDIEFSDTHLLPDYPNLKTEIMDLRVVTSSGLKTNVELQLLPHDSIRERFLLYLVRAFSLQLVRGGEYGDLRKVILIVIVDFTLLKEEKEFINRYLLQNQKSGNIS
jgi:predicted transposase/invertase (TIGR01784 family)